MNGDMQMQMEAHHFCSQMNEEMHQCVLFDGNDKNAMVIGIELHCKQKNLRFSASRRKAFVAHPCLRNEVRMCVVGYAFCSPRKAPNCLRLTIKKFIIAFRCVFR